MTEVLEGQVSMYDLGMLSTKMSPALSRAESQRAQTSPQSSKRSSKSRSREPLCMCVYRTEDGPTQGAITLKMAHGALLGDFTTRGFGESPREENVSLLSQILEDSAPPKYFLSERACMGILARAEGLVVTASDIQSGFDFLDRDFELDGRWIITNPPFSLAEAFIHRASELGRPFALLLKSQYWNSAKRRPLFLEHTPSYVLPLTWRPDFTGKGGSMLDMCWNVWLGGNGSTIYQPLPKPKL